MRSPKLSSLLCFVSLHLLTVAMSDAAENETTGARELTNVVEVMVPFTAADGIALEGKLSVPADAKGPVPVVFYLHGAGPRTVDNSIQYRDEEGRIAVYRYHDFHSTELARRGVAFFRINKRGCTMETSGRLKFDGPAFARATPSVLLDDYEKALAALRGRSEIDTNKIVLFGSSEGTRLAPQLAARLPGGIVGLALMSYQSANQRETIAWQNQIGPWRNIQKLIPEAGDGKLTRAEYDAALQRNGAIERILPFKSLDTDADDTLKSEELLALTQKRLDAILKAVEDRDDDLIQKALMNLTSAYLLDDWSGDPTHVTLMKLEVPIAIFHGELDGTTSIEGVREAGKAFQAAGRTNLAVHAYADHDHDLNWTIDTARRGGTAPFQDAFNFVKKLVGSR